MLKSYLTILTIFTVIYSSMLLFFTIISLLVNLGDQKYQRLLTQVVQNKSIPLLIMALPLIQYSLVHKLLIKTEKWDWIHTLYRCSLVTLCLFLAWVNPAFSVLVIFYANFLVSGLAFTVSYETIPVFQRFIIKHIFHNDSNFASEFMEFFYGN